MANATDNLHEAETMIKGILSGREKERALMICRWLFEKNQQLSNHKIKCYCTNVPDVCFCIDWGGDCDFKRIRTWFFRIRNGQLCILRSNNPSVPYIQPRPGTKDFHILPDDAMQLSDDELKQCVQESYIFMCSKE